MDAPRILVRDLEAGPVLRVSPDLTLQEAARILATSGSGTLVVDTVPLSEFTEHDVVRAVALGTPCDTTLGELVRPAPGFVHLDTVVHELAVALLESGRHSAVIVDERGQPVGILHLANVTAAILGGPPWLGALRVALRVERPL